MRLHVPMILLSMMFLTIGILWEIALRVSWLGEKWYGSQWGKSMADANRRHQLHIWGRLIGGGYFLLGCHSMLFAMLRTQGIEGLALWGPSATLLFLSLLMFILAIRHTPR